MPAKVPHHPLPHELDDVLRRELDEGERLIWAGQPIPALMARQARPALWGSAVCFLGAGLLACGFGTMVLDGWENGRFINQRGEPAPWGAIVAMGALSVLFVGGTLAGGITLLLAPTRARVRALRTAYAITDRRAIVLMLDSRGRTEERDYRRDELLHLLRKENADGMGDVVFEGVLRGRRQGSGPPLIHGFLGVAAAQEVERLLRETFGGGELPRP